MSSPRYVITQEVLDRYHISKTTLLRWEKDEKLGFPKAIWLNGRKLYPLDQLEAFEQKRAGSSRGRAA